MAAWFHPQTEDPESPGIPIYARASCVCHPVSVCSSRYIPGPSSLWGAEAGSGLGVTGCPVALAAELAGRAIAARGAGLKAVRGLQARGTGTCPTLGVTGAAVAAIARLVTLWPPHSWGASWGMRGWEGVTRGLAPPQLQLVPVSLSWPPHNAPMPGFGPSPAAHPQKRQLAAVGLCWVVVRGPQHLCPVGRVCLPGGTEGPTLQPPATHHWSSRHPASLAHTGTDWAPHSGHGHTPEHRALGQRRGWE